METVATGLKTPVPEAIEKTPKSFDPPFATYRKLPPGSMLTESGPLPLETKGEPAITVKVPLVELTA